MVRLALKSNFRFQLLSRCSGDSFGKYFRHEVILPHCLRCLLQSLGVSKNGCSCRENKLVFSDVLVLLKHGSLNW